ncbi:NUDIX hydrolase [Candidatus Woesebacteria bacterium]|nr:NUDIX hydrolase [Candidatus Woesebacteria bacterium]MCD8507341.1 NUDIX hydrolase [Candidatus Woesebacteria bacterium]MCD8527588.1 NUDIX hydrolase [Candidatus Woesebacteria bacterium]MCD8546440.1 NUDIX hydrolase [Candidatus Woesebacteria bacterium]
MFIKCPPIVFIINRQFNDRSHKDIEETAKHELEEETGIKTQNVEYFGMFAGFVTKATEKIYCYFVDNAEFNSQQNLDENEEIEVVEYTFDEVEKLIQNNQINAAITVAAWDLAKRKYSHRFSSWK